MADLHLPLKGEYFDQIVSGEKVEEYRYPKKTDTSRRAEFPWRGCQLKTITHPHFGPDPVKVYAIEVRR